MGEAGLCDREGDLGARQGLPRSLQGPDTVGAPEIRYATGCADAGARESHDAPSLLNLQRQRLWQQQQAVARSLPTAAVPLLQAAGGRDSSSMLCGNQLRMFTAILPHWLCL